MRATARIALRRALSCAAALLLAAGGDAAALSIAFDYRFDRGFFTAVDGSPIVERRAALERAALVFAGFGDTLAPIAPAAGDAWSVTMRHPSWSNYFETATVTGLVVPADTLVVFVGGSPSASSVLGIAEAGNTTASGTAGFVATVAARGQDAALASTPRDYGPWGGSIWFNSAQSWYFGADPPAGGSTQPDFLTTATHEIGHLLGFGEAPSWRALIEGAPGAYRFAGMAASALFGGTVPLDAIGAHWAAGVTGQVDGALQGALMDPSTARGTRERMTDLDLAGFADIGWQVSAVPELPPAALFAAGVALLALRRRCRTTPAEPRPRAEPDASEEPPCVPGDP